MSIDSETINIKKIATGYVVELRDPHYTCTTSAFPTWVDTVAFINQNPPRFFDNVYNPKTELYENTLVN